MEQDYFSTRATVREYTDEEVSDEMLRDVIQKAVHAPTCGNMQLYSVIVTRDREMKSRLEPLHFNQPASTGCNIILTICADFNRFTRWCEIREAKPGYNNFHSFVEAMTDAVIFAQQIVTIAEMKGIGTCYLGTVNYNAAEIACLLDLPDLVVPVASISLGYPKNKPEQSERLPIDAVMHYERYRKDSDSEIERLFSDKENFATNRKFVEENNKRNLAEVFTDIRYPKEMNETVSASFLNILKEKGFL